MNIAVHIQSVGEFTFYQRIAQAADELGHTVIIITPKLSIHIGALARGITSHLIYQSGNTHRSQALDSTIEVKSAMTDELTATSHYNGVIECITSVHKTISIDLLLIWNGSTVPTAALAQFAEKNKIPTLFMELSNIPGKIFVDPKGVNAQSLLYSDPQILDRFPTVDEEIYDEWKMKYINAKRVQQTTPTAIYQKDINNLFFLVDAFGSNVMGLPAIGNMNLWSKIKEKILSRPRFNNWDQYDINRGKYIFFPLQLSYDSQILFNSSMDNADGIRYCIAEGIKKGLDVIVKPHPTGIASTVLDQLAGMKNESPIIISNEPTMELIEKAEEVVTINSTVGLEAMIVGKKATFLGKSFYPLLHHEALKKYIMHYLIDIEYFSSESISAKMLERIIGRATK